MDGTVLTLIFGVVAGVICAAVAASKGRNAVGWFFFGFFFALVAIIVVLVVSNKKEERARFEHAARERRRLREELNLERIRNQQFRGAAIQRLDVHDRALGVDTRHLAPPPAIGTQGFPAIGAPAVDAPTVVPVGSDGPGPDGAPPIAPFIAVPPVGDWHYATPDGATFGPVTYADLREAWASGTVGEESLVWKAGWKDWHRVADVPELLQKLRS